MLAAYAVSLNPKDPLKGLVVGERPEPDPPENWITVQVRAAALSHHDIWSLHGIGLSEDRLPMILGGDAAGVDPDGNEVIVYSCISSDGWHADETLDPQRTLLAELHQGALAEAVAVPRRNVIPKPPQLSFEQAACLPVAWLSAYRMLFTRGQARPGQTVLVQGATGGVSTALISLGAHAGLRIWATSRSERGRNLALGLGAEAAFEAGARLPERVDLVMETNGAATWAHSLRALKPGGTVVVCGTTTGDASPAELNRIFYKQLSVLGSTAGTREELELVTQMVVKHGIQPQIDRVLPLSEARTGFEAMLAGEVAGKIVFHV
jgi:NADPH:quinone reductase-like Zn-dependent oxidoreductase